MSHEIEPYIAGGANGTGWLPEFVGYVDPKRCIGCGRCVWMCHNSCYEMKKIGRKVIAVVVRDTPCFGDCHCHTVCPVKGGAMTCASKKTSEFSSDIENGFSFRKDGKKWKQEFDIAVDSEKCTGCGDCARICQRMVFDMKMEGEKQKAVIVDPEMCMGDLHCVSVCQYSAILIE